MKVCFYKLTCLTNLHMGGGDVNYDVIDLEVERDPVLGEPTMNSSGVKGALRDFCEKTLSEKDVTYIFGSKGSGSNKGNFIFLSGDLIARPVRVSEGSGSYVLATTPELLENVGTKLAAFELTDLNTTLTTLPDKAEDSVWMNPDCVGIEAVEGRKVKNLQNETLISTLTNLLGKNWAVMTPEQLRSVDLPVLAHNVLSDGISTNLWYEQVVPHKSVFGLIIAMPDDSSELNDKFQAAVNNKVIQFGANATTGYGLMKVEKVSFEEEAK